MSKISFSKKSDEGFYSTVKKRVDDYFSSRNMSKKANLFMVLKSVFFLGGALTCYLLIITGQFNYSLNAMWGVTLLLGAFSAFIGFNVSHDAIHGSYSSNSFINNFLSYSFCFIGANPYMWSITHNIVHHTFTNIPGHDEDIDVAKGLVRLSPIEPRTPIIKYQHYYAFLLYGFAAISWVFRKDFKKFFQKQIGNYDNTNHPKNEAFKLFFFKGLYYFLTIVLPLYLLPITWYQFLIGYITMQLLKGFIIGLVFQLAHVVEGTEFPEPDENGSVEDSWAVHQMKTTANFATKSWLASFLCGGLNFQVEHHLFPKICHIHYPALNKIVRNTAFEFGVPYLENETFILALQSHYRVLKHFAQND